MEKMSDSYKDIDMPDDLSFMDEWELAWYHWFRFWKKLAKALNDKQTVDFFDQEWVK